MKEKAEDKIIKCRKGRRGEAIRSFNDLKKPIRLLTLGDFPERPLTENMFKEIVSNFKRKRLSIPVFYSFDYSLVGEVGKIWKEKNSLWIKLKNVSGEAKKLFQSEPKSFSLSSSALVDPDCDDKGTTGLLRVTLLRKLIGIPIEKELEGKR
jgi:hypothetical protein